MNGEPGTAMTGVAEKIPPHNHGGLKKVLDTESVMRYNPVHPWNKGFDSPDFRSDFADFMNLAQEGVTLWRAGFLLGSMRKLSFSQIERRQLFVFAAPGSHK